MPETKAESVKAEKDETTVKVEVHEARRSSYLARRRWDSALLASVYSFSRFVPDEAPNFRRSGYAQQQRCGSFTQARRIAST